MGSTAEYTRPASTGDSPSSDRAPTAEAANSPSPSGSTPKAPVEPRPAVEIVADDATVIRPPEKQLAAGGGAQPGGTIVPAPSHELSKLLAGERLGNYELLEFAGGGGMGAVFRARDLTLHREVAIKVLSRDQAVDDETLKRFKNEAQSAARLDHDNIARVHYVGEDRGLHYIVFEFIEGVNVRQLVERRGVLPLDDALSYTLQIADALAHATTRDVVHRDIKPSNIIITQQGKAKLVDMGLARLHGMKPGEDLTASGVTLGTFDYISPEQARDPRSADVRSDIYSLGCTLYFMLTGRPPFPEGTVLQKLLQHNSDDPIDPREYNPGLPDTITTILRKMLAKDPQRRYQTPADLIADLLHLAERLGIQRNEVRLATKWEAAPGEHSAWQRHLPWLVPLAALAIVVIGLEINDRRNEQRWTSQWQSTHGAAPAVSPPKGTGPTLPQPLASATPVGSIPVAIATATPPTVPAPTLTAVAPPLIAPTTEPAVRKLPEPREGVLVVCDTPDGAGRFTSLRAACFEAKNGDVIELCYDGERIERPLMLNNLKITIRAGEGFKPAVRFRPADAAIPNMPRSMISLVGGRLTFVRLEIVFDVPSPQDLPAADWSLISLQQADYLGLELCTLSVRNASGEGLTYHPDVAVIGMSQPPGSPGMLNMRMPNEPMPADVAARAVDVALDHCIVRGEASLLRVVDVQPVALRWHNGLLAMSESALVVNGGQLQSDETEVQFDLNHVTAVVGGQFIRITDGFETPFLPDVSVNCTDSILLSTRGAPLVDYDGIDVRNDFLNSFQWTGERVFYEGFQADGFWRLASGDDVTQMLSYDDWRAQWGPQREFQSAWRELRWKRSLPPQWSFQSLRPDEFELAETVPPQKALRGGADGSDIGMHLAELPQPGATVVAADLDDGADDESRADAGDVR
jgi:serine/threonine protein kinase